MSTRTARYGSRIPLKVSWRFNRTALFSRSMEMTEKRCSKCKQVKPTDGFCSHRGTRSGLNSWCRQCIREAPEIRARQAIYRGLHRAERHVAETIYYVKHRMKRLAYQRAYRITHSEEKKAYRLGVIRRQKLGSPAEVRPVSRTVS